MFRWPDENPERRRLCVALQQAARHAWVEARLQLVARLANTHHRGRLTRWLRMQPLPVALGLACGLGSAAWAIHNVGSGLSLPLATLVGNADSKTADTQPAGDATPVQPRSDAQWGDRLPTLGGDSTTAAHGISPPLPPATARRNAGTVVLASQYYGIAPYEPTLAERGHLLAALPSAQGHAPTVDEAPSATKSDVVESTRVSAPVYAAGPTAVSAGASPSSTHLAQLSEWIGLAETLPLPHASNSTQPAEPALTLLQAAELGRMQQRRQLEQRAGHRYDARKLPPLAAGARQAAPVLADPGVASAQAFINTLQARMNHALAQRHERQLNRVVGQARTAWTQSGRSSATRNRQADQALKLARTRLGETQTEQKRQLERLTPLIGHNPAALAWGSASDLGLQSSERLAAKPAHQQDLLSAPDLFDAVARRSTFEHRMRSLHQRLLAHAQVAGSLHTQMLQGRKELAEVVQAYERLHNSRVAVAALAVEELQSQLQVAQATGWLLQAPRTAAQSPALSIAGLMPQR